MPAWPRKSDSGRLDNLARKARRRGDAAEAAHWYRALALRQAAEERQHLAAERRWRFNHGKTRWERLEDELRVLRTYYATTSGTSAALRAGESEKAVTSA
jgi:hypothetical protein